MDYSTSRGEGVLARTRLTAEVALIIALEARHGQNEIIVHVEPDVSLLVQAKLFQSCRE